MPRAAIAGITGRPKWRHAKLDNIARDLVDRCFTRTSPNQLSLRKLRRFNRLVVAVCRADVPRRSSRIGSWPWPWQQWSTCRKAAAGSCKLGNEADRDRDRAGRGDRPCRIVVPGRGQRFLLHPVEFVLHGT
jgi:hypothetical protein